MAEKGLDGRHLRIGTVASSYLYGPYDPSHKVLPIIDLLRSRLNFTYELVTSKSLGKLHENGSWSGLVGLLQTNEIDVIASRVPIIPTFIEAVDITIPLGQDEWVTLQRQSSSRSALSGLLSPFRMEVWLLVALSVLGMIPVMYAIYRMYLKFLPDEWNKFRRKFNDFVLFVVVSLLRQDHKLHISTHSQRVLMATWWIAGIVLTTFYTANLTASLARPFRAKSVQYPAELSLPDYKDVRWTTLQGEAFYALIQNDKETASVQTLRQHVKNGRGIPVNSIKAAVDLTKTQGYVWFGEKVMLLEVLLADYSWNRAKNTSKSSNVCTFLITEKSYASIEYGFALAKNSPLTESFNKALWAIDQAGLLERANRPSFTGKNPCSLTGGYTSRPMQIWDFLGLFYIVSIGLGFSFIVFLAEKIGNDLRHHWQKRKVDRPPSQERQEELPDQHELHQVVSPDVTDLTAAIDKLMEDVDQLLSQDDNIRGIFRDLLSTKRDPHSLIT